MSLRYIVWIESPVVIHKVGAVHQYQHPARQAPYGSGELSEPRWDGILDQVACDHPQSKGSQPAVQATCSPVAKRNGRIERSSLGQNPRYKIWIELPVVIHKVGAVSLPYKQPSRQSPNETGELSDRRWDGIVNGWILTRSWDRVACGHPQSKGSQPAVKETCSPVAKRNGRIE
ncbi:hypothetical protein HW555_001538 [Spodoptera exigua]|uniref:Uncharacterized protein n=1 Tax=Spodoptera exigua TaxID=7107 RepID=A0A835LB60_SPOEX|nr:hypothetical protein HW555_001538 [Spodoptera exigua]